MGMQWYCQIQICYNFIRYVLMYRHSTAKITSGFGARTLLAASLAHIADTRCDNPLVDVVLPPRLVTALGLFDCE